MPKYLVRRLGNKAAIAKQIAAHFPRRIDMWVEPFFGGGGMYFNKGFTAPYNILNDLDSDVYNLWNIVTNPDQFAEFKRVYALMPYHADLLRYWKTNTETDPIRKALRFVFLSGFTFMGAGDTLKYETRSHKQMSLSAIEAALSDMQYCKFNNTTADKFVASISYNTNDPFIYADPPYIGTGSNYENKSWGRADLDTFILACKKTGAPFAISEFLTDTTREVAEAHGLNIVSVRQRIAMDRPVTEVLMTNYAQEGRLF